MIETVFSKSAYGSLKLAQNCGADKHSSASIGLVLSGRTNISPEELETLKADAELQAHRKWETSIPLGGNPADVYCIDVAWSMGDISDDEIGNNRKSVLEQAFFVWPNREDMVERDADRRGFLQHIMCDQHLCPPLFQSRFLRQSAGRSDERICTLLHTPSLKKFAERVSTF